MTSSITTRPDGSAPDHDPGRERMSDVHLLPLPLPNDVLDRLQVRYDAPTGTGQFWFQDLLVATVRVEDLVEHLQPGELLEIQWQDRIWTVTEGMPG